jgi:hypothetical protein
LGAKHWSGAKHKEAEREGESPNGHCIAKQARQTRPRTSNNEMTLIYCKDTVTPVGPLALLYARIHHSIHPPPNGDVHVTTPKLSFLQETKLKNFRDADVKKYPTNENSG